ncbi:hypothetical protein [Micromonospora sp. C81]|uniref:hypothetical protein n=1 Tax=Micromonospora sp. C81 TaxID=2824881 RepID=UPI001B36AC98|nr:hypothetical protein [Micromonospora sp. C81]MBQ1037193.1 hypothetical protein [Micromonospora sp. C81]
MSMERVEAPATLLTWLADRPKWEAATGYHPARWESSTWILHAMYENPRFAGLGTHDELHRHGRESGDLAPLIVGDINLDEGTTETGIPLGFVVRPGNPWRRVLWSQHLTGERGQAPDRRYPPCHRWFPHNSWPVAVQPPPEGSLDEESLDALLDALCRHSAAGPSTDCVAFYASLPANDFDNLHVWRGPLSAVPGLLEERGGPYPFSPTNLWPTDRSWLIWTDYDLQGTRISGSRSLIEAVRSHPALETVDWSGQLG